MSWSLYEALLEPIGDDPVIEGVVSPKWSFVTTANGSGLAMTPLEVLRRTSLAGRMRGMPLRELAEHVRSWDLQEATIAMAGVNAHHNDVATLEAHGDVLLAGSGLPFLPAWLDILGFRRAAFIGHGPFLDTYEGACEITILERAPQEGDLPDTACDFVLPDQDAVFITGTTFPNKTIVHLLDICRRAGNFVVLWGPTVPLTPQLFDWGVDAVLGTAVRDAEGVRRAICEGCYVLDFREHLETVLLIEDRGVRAAIDACRTGR